MRGLVPRLGVIVVAAGLVLMSTATAPVAVRAAGPQPGPEAVEARALLTRYCVGCHSEAQRLRGAVPIALDKLEMSDLSGDAKVWETVEPEDARGVDAARGNGLIPTWLATMPSSAGSKRSSTARPSVIRTPGRTEPFHRLNRAQYQNAIRDLLNLEIDVTSLLPSDDSSYGFDNIAGVLKMSPTLMERYLSAAQKISRAAVGTAPPTPTVDYFRVADDLAQDRRLPGQSFGSRGGDEDPLRPSRWTPELRRSAFSCSRDLKRGRAALHRGSAGSR